ncbi:MAG: hypothetical protein ACRDOI_31130 [Trebonia sp.]
MSEYFRAPRRALTPLPAGLAVRDACLVEPGSVAWHACRLGLVGPGMRRGTVVYVGIYEHTELPHAAMAPKEVALRPSLGYCAHDGRREFAEVADMLAARPELPELLITHRYPIADAVAAFSTAANRSNWVFRVVVEP